MTDSDGGVGVISASCAIAVWAMFASACVALACSVVPVDIVAIAMHASLS